MGKKELDITLEILKIVDEKIKYIYVINYTFKKITHYMSLLV